MILSLIFLSIASACNSVIDTLQHHFWRSIFDDKKRFKREFWDATLSWSNKYNDDGSLRKIKILKWKINYPVQITDAFHLFKTIMIIFIVLAIVFHFALTKLTIKNCLIEILLYGVCWNATFSLFYNRILIKKNERRKNK